ncbi:MAG: hypothetical protein LQ351_004367 [Letrouitia transgressa]|nr:MAG: hypothetical protein LQ351_004367 [Letrouitia transgressa]
MSNSGVNVLRYSALLIGCGYGFYHQRTITSKAKQDHLDHEYRRQERLIQQAKAEWSKKTAPKDTTPGGEWTTITLFLGAGKRGKMSGSMPS